MGDLLLQFVVLIHQPALLLLQSFRLAARNKDGMPTQTGVGTVGDHKLTQLVDFCVREEHNSSVHWCRSR